MPKYKKKASKAMSRFVRLRDALAYCRLKGIDISQFARPEDIIGRCCTCQAVKSWIRMDAGHFKGRGVGGGSGVYFDERNVHLQCKPCNGFKGGAPDEYKEFMLHKYGEKTVAEIERKHKLPTSFKDIAMIGTRIFYEEKYGELFKTIK